MLVANYTVSQLLPAFGRDRAVTRNLALPYGGPTATGNILFSTKGFALGSTYSVLLEMRKKDKL